MQYISSKDGTRIAYEQTGHGTPIILIDGAMGHRNYMGSRQLAEELSKGFKVIIYDRRGRGESSDTLPYTVEREIEDIEALIDSLGGQVSLYGFSSGAVLALRAAANLGKKVNKLAVLEPPFNSNDEMEIREFEEYCKQMERLLSEGKKSEAVYYFLKDMLPPESLEEMKQSPEWQIMESVAHTLKYENEVMGNGGVPPEASTLAIPVLVLVGSESPDYKHLAVQDLVKSLPQGTLKKLHGYTTMVPPDVLAPVLGKFFVHNKTFA